jgi:endonuclease YncB( thermonuclease family)
MRAARIFRPAELIGGKVNHLQVQVCHGTAKGYLLGRGQRRHTLLLSQGWAELADEVTEASYVEALASAQSKKVGIWGDGPP